MRRIEQLRHGGCDLAVYSKSSAFRMRPVPAQQHPLQ
jgi:hypothetical protein